MNKPDKSNLETQEKLNPIDFVYRSVQQLTSEIQELYCLDEIPWIIGYSGGKDSTAVLQLVWNSIINLSVEKRNKKIYIISTDTRVENPIVASWVKQSHQRIKERAQADELPFEAHLLYPEVKDTYWVNLLGKGYPAPRQRFRWCTERLKILPANRFIKEQVRASGETILVLGVRKAESITRAVTMKKYQKGRVKDRLSPNVSLPYSWIYSPIEDWDNNEVWIYLHQYSNPWGHSNKELFQLYRGATEDNECPLVIDTSTPSCGDSRFGCWVCTLVNQDKSMQAMVLNNEDKAWMEPLLKLRNELDFRSEEKREKERNNRDFRRIRGNVQLFERKIKGSNTTEIVNIPGPYIKSHRENLLRLLLQAQMDVRTNAPDNMKDIELISLDELSTIRRIWLEEKHEFDDSLPRIYREVTGEIFRDPKPPLPNSLGYNEWKILKEVCEEDTVHLELLKNLLDTEQQYLTMSQRRGIYEELEKCFANSSRNKKDAIKKARYERRLNEAMIEGDIETVQNITLSSFDEETVENRLDDENITEQKSLLLEDIEITYDNLKKETEELTWRQIKFNSNKKL